MNDDRREWAQTWADGAPLDEAVREAVRDAVREHRRHHHRIAVWEDDQVRIIEGEAIPDQDATLTLFAPASQAGLDEVEATRWRSLPSSESLELYDDPGAAIEASRRRLGATGQPGFLLAFEVPRHLVSESHPIVLSEGDRETLEMAIVGRIRVVAEFAREVP